MKCLGDWYVVVFLFNDEPIKVGTFTEERPTCNVRYKLKTVGKELSHNTAKTLETMVSLDLGIPTY